MARRNSYPGNLPKLCLILFIAAIICGITFVDAASLRVVDLKEPTQVNVGVAAGINNDSFTVAQKNPSINMPSLNQDRINITSSEKQVGLKLFDGSTIIQDKTTIDRSLADLESLIKTESFQLSDPESLKTKVMSSTTSGSSFNVTWTLYDYVKYASSDPSHAILYSLTWEVGLEGYNSKGVFGYSKSQNLLIGDKYEMMHDNAPTHCYTRLLIDPINNKITVQWFLGDAPSPYSEELLDIERIGGITFAGKDNHFPYIVNFAFSPLI